MKSPIGYINITLAALFFLPFLAVQSYSKERVLGQSDVGRRIEFTSARCGESGLYQPKATIQIIVVGNSGNLNCIIRITEKLLKASDFKAGYACVTAYSAKPAAFVRKDDPRVVRERGYAAQLAIAEQYAKKYKIGIQVVYITTNQGPPHSEARCKKLLLGA
ncbi:MAG: hypothetical protein J0I79_30805 [Mesorhizobium sp.]|uniref:hypothetical protein n=1 Tax=Mesorhizobium sp. TaxID=1871066 RepID=UPI001ACF3976|nr:hypothetical protein [Mesorhizobium sp.]MBN9222352.1 hypothetical protein [Mesorhizobium sp.]